MANYKLNYTGEQVNEAIGKAKAIPSASDISDVVSRALKKPLQVLENNELVGVGTDGEQISVKLGSGLTLEGSASPYTLKASGSLYTHYIHFAMPQNSSVSFSRVYLKIVNGTQEPYTLSTLKTHLSNVSPEYEHVYGGFGKGTGTSINGGVYNGLRYANNEWEFIGCGIVSSGGMDTFGINRTDENSFTEFTDKVIPM